MSKAPKTYDLPQNAIAIIGMSGRFPGAKDLPTFWENLRQGRDTISRFDEAELDDTFGPEIRNQPNFVKARPILDDVDQFDAGFFSMYPREAAITDPQHRLMLECAWEALEDGGVDPAKCEGSIGIFAGCTYNSYFLKHVLGTTEAIQEFTSSMQLGDYPRYVGATPDTLATRVAFKLNLRGPAINVQSCCSTSLLAVAQAVQSLLLYESDMALAGGVSITFPQKRGYLYAEGGMASVDGSVRPFDSDAAGTIFGHGAGLVLLKRLEDAIADGDHIYAVIRSAAINNDGADKMAFTAPSVDGQAAVIMTTHLTAGVDASTIGYIEAHGTGTPLGDPIEIAGLTKAFAATTDAKNFCALGSVKSNVGHLDAAAGIAGLIKAAFTLEHNEIPPLVNFKAPNPRINFAETPFFISEKLQPYPETDGPRRAGVSSFGVGGNNVHVLLEEAPPVSARAAIAPRVEILPVSARSDTSVNAMKAALADFIEQNPDAPLGDIAYTLQSGRRAFAKRTTIAVKDRADAITKLRGSSAIVATQESLPPVIFMFPGQGAQYPGMSKGLYESEPLFRSIVDRGAEVLKPLLRLDLRDPLYNEVDAGEDAPHPIRSTILAQPALFLVEYATARLLMSWGVKPTAMVGHSVGEFVAACIAGVMSFEDALTLIAARGRLMQSQAPGAMLSIRLPEAEVRPLLGPDVDLAAINAPGLCVVAGPFDAVEALEKRLAETNIAHRRLHTSHAFHSRMMDGVLAPLAAEAAKLSFGAPKIPYVSGATGKWATPADATGDAWARHCREPVRFADALATACEGRKPILIEVGSGRALSMLSAQIVTKDKLAALTNTLPDVSREPEDVIVIADAVGKVWAAGGAPDFDAYNGDLRRRISLPTYRFDRQRHWIDPPAQSAAPQAPAQIQTPVAQAPGSFMPAPVLPAAPQVLPETVVVMSAQMTPEAHKASLRDSLVKILEDLSGEQIADQDPETTFLELGFDSLFLGQVATAIQSKFSVKLTFRQLLGDYPSVEAVSAHLAQSVPIPAAAPVAQTAPAAAPAPARQAQPVMQAAPQMMASMPAMQMPMGAPVAPSGDMAGLFQMQLAAMQNVITQQFALMQGGVVVPQQVAMPAPVAQSVAQAAPAPVVAPAPQAAAPAPASTDEDNTPARFRAYKKGALKQRNDGITDEQRRYIDEVSAKINARLPTSKRMTQQHRPYLADPRTAAGFRADWKEIVFPLFSERSKGSRVWDVDGNEYIDLVNGFGQTAFGHAPDFVTTAIAKQLEQGFAVGPQSPLAGETAGRICRMIGMDRVTFCNTGSEAVMAAMRAARAVSGRSKVVVFGNDYHGQFDEVLVRPGRRNGPPGAAPAAPGITQENVANMIVLPYGDETSLDWIRANAGDLAAVIVEPVQSRHPELQPVDFLRKLRTLTAELDVCYVFDEVITGFRSHPGGAQALFGVKADLATYGKVIGGGMPIGLLAGSRKYMDVLDGGMWQYGDDSLPEVAPTFFAGTFVRHPLTIAAASAVMDYMEENGPTLQERLSANMKSLADRINADLERRGMSTRANLFSSFFYINFAAEHPLGGLIYHVLRTKGVAVQEGFPCYLTTAHSQADLDFIAKAFSDALDEMQGVGIFTGNGERPAVSAPAALPAAAPVPVATPVAATLSDAPPTEPQTEIWLAAQLSDAASCSFNESLWLRLEGTLNADALTAAFNDVLARHDALRAAFSASGETIYFGPSLTVSALPMNDLSGQADPEAALKALVHTEATTPFDLVAGPLFRAQIARLSATSHVFVFTAHHIVCDGWSGNIVVEELAKCYAARVSGAPQDLQPAMSFAHYATQQKQKASDAATEAFWLGQFKDVPALPQLPGDRARPPIKSFNGATATARIDAQTYRDVKKAGAKLGCTMFSTLFATLQVLVGRLAKQDDIVLAVPTAGQTLVEGQILVGHCVNFLPIRAAFDPAAPVADHLRNVKKATLEAFDHGDYTFGTLVRKLALKRDMNRLPLTEIQFNLERVPEKLAMPGLISRTGPNPKAFSNFDLFWNVIESDDGLRIDCDYNTDLFDASTIERWISHYRTLLQAIAADATTPINALPLMSKAELTWMMDELNNTTAAFPRNAFVHEIVSEHARRSPDAIAVTDADGAMTYRELEARSNRLARRLQAIAPQGRSRFAIAMERSCEMVVALLSVMKSGHAYVPLDPEHPAQRLQQIIDGAQIAGLICDSDANAALAPDGVNVVRYDLEARNIANDDAAQPAPVTGDTDRAAYVIFTSGSTGAPKGVEVPHRAYVNFLASMAKAPGFTSKDAILAVTTISFDIAGLEIFLPLITGGRVILASRMEVRGGFGLVDRIANDKPTVLQATPSLYRILLEAGFKPSPNIKLLCGGEPLPRDLADQLLAGGGELWNMYGPTETTIWSSTGLVKKDGAINIGAPIDNTSLHILDANDRLAPIGVVGDLYIGGDGLANGYFNRPDLTQAVFRDIALEGGPVQRLYKTGDVAKRQTNGGIQHLGRSDHQVKLRGFRIELEDIEAALRRAAGIGSCAVAIREINGEPRLVGYYVPTDGAVLRPAALAEHMASQVPNYMVPGMWMQLDALPLTPNRKLDRKALPMPAAAAGAASGRPVTAPRSGMEQQIAAVWKEVLAADEIGAHDNLFFLGADSLHVFRIAARLIDKNLPVEAKDLLKHPTVAEIASLVETRTAQTAATPANTSASSLRDFRGGARRRPSS